MREYPREGRDLKMRKWCIRKREQGWSGDGIAAHLGIPRSTAYHWMDKYKGCSMEEMEDRPRRIATEIDDRTRGFVIRLREENSWGPCRIESYIKSVTGARIEHEATTEFALRLFKKCTRRYGFPEQVLTTRDRSSTVLRKTPRRSGSWESST